MIIKIESSCSEKSRKDKKENASQLRKEKRKREFCQREKEEIARRALFCNAKLWKINSIASSFNLDCASDFLGDLARYLHFDVR